MNNEQLQSNELLSNIPDDSSLSPARLDEQGISLVIQKRKKMLEGIKTQISRKLFFKIEEKLQEEEKTLREILDWQNGKKAFYSKYTLVLDPRYFEQEFLG